MVLPSLSQTLNEISEWSQGIHFLRSQLTSPLATKLQYYKKKTCNSGAWDPGWKGALGYQNGITWDRIKDVAFTAKPPSADESPSSSSHFLLGLPYSPAAIPPTACFGRKCWVVVFAPQHKKFLLWSRAPIASHHDLWRLWRPVPVVFLQRWAARAISKKPSHWCPLSLGIGMAKVAPCWV